LDRPFGIAVRSDSPPTATAAVPTINEWGMIILSALAGLASVYYLYRRREDITA